MEYHDQLDLSPAEFDELRERFESAEYEGRSYRFLPSYERSLERGTVLIEGAVVRGFPKVPRTLVLESGVPNFFEDRFAVEEKLNGYNVRIADVPEFDEPLAFTRSGRLCPFTTGRVRSVLDLDPFFESKPEAVLCGEMIGPENPYTVHNYEGVDSLSFRAFDVMDRETGESMPVDERRDLCEAFDLLQADRIGTFDPASGAEEVIEAVDELEDRGREGVVMKSLDGDRQLKYTTSAANRDDLAFAFSLPFDYGQDFMFRRLVREGFRAVELEADDEALADRARELGEAILLPMVESIRTVADGGEVAEEHTVRAPPEEVEALLEHLENQGLTLTIEEDRRDGSERVVTFRKRVQSTNDKIRSYLEGNIVRE